MKNFKKLSVIMCFIIMFTFTLSAQAAPKKKVTKPATKKTTKVVLKPTEKLSTKFYQCEKGNFKIKLPANWTIEEDKGDELYGITASSKDGMAQIMVSGGKGYLGLSSADAMKVASAEFNKEIKASFKNVKEISKKKVTLNGQDAYIVEYTASLTENNITVKFGISVLCAVNDDYFYYATVVGAEPRWTRNAPIYRQSLMSITPISTQPVEPETDATTETP